METKNNPTKGDWVVHPYHGVGLLRGKETKQIGGHDSNYFRLEIENGAVFIPENKMNSESFRHVVSEKTILEVIDILSEPPKAMDSKVFVRTNWINNVMKENSIHGIARIIRDLYGRRKGGNMLSATEETLLKKLNKRLVSEWAIVSGLDEVEADRKMKALLVDKD